MVPLMHGSNNTYDTNNDDANHINDTTSDHNDNDNNTYDASN